MFTEQTLSIRTATENDIDEISRLIAASARELASTDYSIEIIEAAFAHGIWGLDKQLILDGTYYLIFIGDQLAACGGWSYRRRLFGATNNSAQENAYLNPNVEPAMIRAFFVNPAFARRGLGSLLLNVCENAAQLAGFREFALAATLPGERLYRRHGYEAGWEFSQDVGNGKTMRGRHMYKQIRQPKKQPKVTEVKEAKRGFSQDSIKSWHPNIANFLITL